jgi:hypothetical protein
MGSNNNQGGAQTSGTSGTDPRGRMQNQSEYQRNRYENQQGPMVNAFAQNYGQGAEQVMGDYTDIMNRYAGIASDPGGFGGASGGNVDYLQSPGTYNPHTISYDDPFNSYAGYQEFSRTGGYSPQDMQDLRERGTAPVRTAYANAEREIGRQRGLGGGYAPNAVAALARMGREQSQGMADAMQNVNAGIVDRRNQGQLAGLGGMQGIENQRLAAQIGVGQFNAGQLTEAEKNNIAQNWALQQANSQIQGRNLSAGASASNQAAALASQRQMGALAGMSNLYGTTPGMAQTFGNQLLQGVGQGGQFGNQLYGNDIQSQRLPGQFDTTMDRINQIGGLANAGANAIYPWLGRGNNTNPSNSWQNDPYSNPGAGGWYME